MVFTGDLDQIDTPYLDSSSNGLAYLISRFIQEENFCHLQLKEGGAFPLGRARGGVVMKIRNLKLLLPRQSPGANKSKGGRMKSG